MLAGLLWPAAAAAIPVFARIYDKPCHACHTVYPQLNPAGEAFRAHGLHGLTPAIQPFELGPYLSVPGTLPLALQFAVGEDLTHTQETGQSRSTRTHFNFEFLSLVYLEGAADAPTPAPGRAVMDQKNLMFVPRVLPIVRGTTVEFTNSDDIQHNVFSPSASAGKFDLGAYGPGAERSVAFDAPGEVVVLRNIHMEMEARILVLREPYFALTGAEGAYRITGVPGGRYTAKVWQDGFLPGTRTVDVPDEGDLVLDLPLNH